MSVAMSVYSVRVSGVSGEAGSEHEALVIYIDPASNCLEFCLSAEVVKGVKHLHDNKFTQVTVATSSYLILYFEVIHAWYHA